MGTAPISTLFQPVEPARFRIENRAGTAELFILDMIGEWGITAQAVADALDGLDAAELVVHINSYGGDAFTGLSIYNLLRDSAPSVTTKVQGLAASAASVIAMAGDQRIMNRGSQIMIHQASGGVFGTAAELRLAADNLEQVTAEIAGVYAERAGGSVDDWMSAMDPESRFSASEAVEAGLATATASDEDEDGMASALAAQVNRVAAMAIIDRVGETGSGTDVDDESGHQGAGSNGVALSGATEHNAGDPGGARQEDDDDGRGPTLADVVGSWRSRAANDGGDSNPFASVT